MINVTPIIDAMRAAGHDPDLDIARLTVDCCRVSRDGTRRCSLSVAADVDDALGFMPPISRCGITDFWRPLPSIVRDAAGAVRWHPVISPVIIEQDGPRTTLRWRGTDEVRPLPDGAADDEIMAAVRAWEGERA